MDRSDVSVRIPRHTRECPEIGEVNALNGFSTEAFFEVLKLIIAETSTFAENKMSKNQEEDLKRIAARVAISIP